MILPVITLSYIQWTLLLIGLLSSATITERERRHTAALIAAMTIAAVLQPRIGRLNHYWWIILYPGLALILFVLVWKLVLFWSGNPWVTPCGIPWIPDCGVRSA